MNRGQGVVKARYLIMPLRAGERTVAIVAASQAPARGGEGAPSSVSRQLLLVGRRVPR